MQEPSVFYELILNNPTFWVSILTAYFAVRQAKRMKLNTWLWGSLGFFFGPLILLVMMFMRWYRGRQPAPQSVARAPLPAASVIEPSVPLLLEDPRTKGWYYVDQARQPVGPLDLNALSGLFQEGTLTLRSLVWHPEMADWAEVQHVPMLGSLLEINPPSCTLNLVSEPAY